MINLFNNELEKLKVEKVNRFLREINKESKYIYYNDKKFLNLNSNDYLGIAHNQEIIDDFFRNYHNKSYTFGSGSSRLLSGNDDIFYKLESYLENKFDELAKTELQNIETAHLEKLIKKKALIFNSGYHLNLGVYSSLLGGKNDVIFSDKLNHASIIDGILLSKSKMYRYNHLDYNHLEDLLKKYRNDYQKAIIVSESLFSMDGDIADLNKLVKLKEKYNAILAIDEAHAFGVYGNNGFGLAEKQNCISKVDIITATFGKAIGSQGAFCISHPVIQEYLINKARPLIFSTALSPISVEFAMYVIEKVMPCLKKERESLLNLSDKLRNALKSKNINTRGESQIIPVIIGENSACEGICKKLQENNFYLLPIRHPTVPLNTARIRISLRSDINYTELEPLVNLLSEQTLS